MAMHLHCFQSLLVLALLLSLAQTLPVTTTVVGTSIEPSQTVQFIRSSPKSTTSLGIVNTALEEGGRTSALPFPTASTTLLDSNAASLPTSLFTTYGSSNTMDYDGINSASSTINLFSPIATTEPNNKFPRLLSHPRQPLGMSKSVIAKNRIPTNNFYSNLFLGDQDNGVLVYPYMVWWNKGVNGDYSLAISHTNRSQLSYGPNPKANPVEYFISPVGIRSVSLSAVEFNSAMTMELDKPTPFSINATFVPSVAKYGRGRSLYVPLVQGAGFVTGLYTGLQPQINSLVGFQALMQRTSPLSGMKKYVAKLYDGNYWVIYARMPTDDSYDLVLKNSSTIMASKRVSSTMIQIASLVSHSETAYDQHAGKYTYGASVYGSSYGSTATYTINYWTKQPNLSGNLLMFALPHHVTSFTSYMKNRYLGFYLDSPSKGKMYAYSTSKLVMAETIPLGIQFAPWTSISGKKANYTSAALGLISKAAVSEVKQNMSTQTNLDSMYYSGKALDKFAYICYVSHAILKNTAVTSYCLKNLKAAFAVFAQNKQINPLYYDQTYNGLISSAAITSGDPNSDFGNSYYNDHHFHYGYHIHAAAIIGYIDSALGGTWVKDNKDYVNSLVRDIANPSDSDHYFPVSRSFSWFHGHSWAKGIFESADGKDEESSSEDYNHAYAIKLWGQVVGDKSMEMRGALMLSIMKRAMNSYMLMNSSNTIQPSNFIGNKVTGILFENKADHTTYFGTNIQYIQGIHMLPITPVSSFIRSPTFVKQEWDSLLSTVAPTLTDGWKGILYANYALYDPTAAYKFFSSSSFKSSYLDGGASLTWYLAYTAGVGGTTA